MHNKAYYKYVEEDAGAQAKSYEKYNTGAKGDKGAKGAKARGRVSLPCHRESICRHPGSRARWCLHANRERRSQRAPRGRAPRPARRRPRRRAATRFGARRPTTFRLSGAARAGPLSVTRPAAAVRSTNRESFRGVGSAGPALDARRARARRSLGAFNAWGTAASNLSLSSASLSGSPKTSPRTSSRFQPQCHSTLYHWTLLALVVASAD